MGKNNKNKERLNYSQIVGAALLNFKEVDQIDLSIFLSDIKQTRQFLVLNEKDDDLEKLFVYNGEQITYDNSNKKRIKKLIPENLLNFFETRYFRNMSKHQLRKQTTLEENQNKIFSKANILVISTNKDDAQLFIKAGFKNVDCISSDIALEKLYMQDETIIDNYNLIVRGSQNLDESITKYFKVNAKIKKLEASKELIETTMQSNPFTDELSFSFGNIENKKTKEALTILINKLIVQKIHKKQKEYKPLNISRPTHQEATKKEDLEILVLGNEKNNLDYYKKKTSLNVDSKFETLPYLFRSVGEYDIILIPKRKLVKTLKYEEAINLACQEAGRKGMLIVGFKDNDVYYDDFVIGTEVSISYRWFGEYGQKLNPQETAFKTQSYKFLKEDWSNIYDFSSAHYSAVVNTLKESTRLYHAGLIRLNQKALTGELFPSLRVEAKKYLEAVDTLTEEDENITIAKYDEFVKIAKQICLKEHNIEPVDILTVTYSNSDYANNIIQILLDNEDSDIRTFYIDGTSCSIVYDGNKTTIYANKEHREFLKFMMDRAKEVQKSFKKKKKVIKVQDSPKNLITLENIIKGLHQDEVNYKNARSNLRRSYLKNLLMPFKNKDNNQKKQELENTKNYLEQEKDKLKNVYTFNTQKLCDFLTQVLTNIYNIPFAQQDYTVIADSDLFSDIRQFIPNYKVLTVIATQKDIENINEEINPFKPSFTISYLIRNIKNIALFYDENIEIYDYENNRVINSLTNGFPQLNDILKDLIDIRLNEKDISEEDAYQKELNKLFPSENVRKYQQ